MFRFEIDQILFMNRDICKFNLFITGIGNVGFKLFEELSKNRNFYIKNHQIDFVIRGISDSEKMYFNTNGISFKNWQHLMKNGEDSNEELFFKKVKNFNLQNSVFVDNTASKKVADSYIHYLKNHIHVVTCNKIACSSDYFYYKEIKKLSSSCKTKFMFETNVGSSLPIIQTLNKINDSGKKIESIHGILSGSMNYIFDNFTTENTFHSIVKDAVNEGFTEPNPKIDLSGIDVARKILILCREMGLKYELSDIHINDFLPKNCSKTNNNKDFFNCLETNSQTFNDILKTSFKENAKIKYVAEFKNGKSTVGIKMIPENHLFHKISSNDNAVLFYVENESDPEETLIGPGAGSLVTAKGVISDIIKIAKDF